MYTIATPYGPVTAATLALAVAIRAILGGHVNRQHAQPRSAAGRK